MERKIELTKYIIKNTRLKAEIDIDLTKRTDVGVDMNFFHIDEIIEDIEKNKIYDEDGTLKVDVDSEGNIPGEVTMLEEKFIKHIMHKSLGFLQGLEISKEFYSKLQSVVNDMLFKPQTAENFAYMNDQFKRIAYEYEASGQMDQMRHKLSEFLYEELREEMQGLNSIVLKR